MRMADEQRQGSCLSGVEPRQDASAAPAKAAAAWSSTPKMQQPCPSRYLRYSICQHRQLCFGIYM